MCEAGFPGIDLEHDRRPSDALVRRVLSRDEQLLPPEAFVVLWAVKEAAMKALGTGFRVAARTVNATVDLEASSARVHMPPEAAGWEPRARLDGRGVFWREGERAIAVVHVPEKD